MGSPNTGALVPITPNDGVKWRCLANPSTNIATANVTIVTKPYGEQTYDLTLQAGQVLPNDCIVNSVSAGTLFGYLMVGQ